MLRHIRSFVAVCDYISADAIREFSAGVCGDANAAVQLEVYSPVFPCFLYPQTSTELNPKILRDSNERIA